MLRTNDKIDKSLLAVLRVSAFFSGARGGGGFFSFLQGVEFY